MKRTFKHNSHATSDTHPRSQLLTPVTHSHQHQRMLAHWKPCSARCAVRANTTHPRITTRLGQQQKRRVVAASTPDSAAPAAPAKPLTPQEEEARFHEAYAKVCCASSSHCKQHQPVRRLCFEPRSFVRPETRSPARSTRSSPPLHQNPTTSIHRHNRPPTRCHPRPQQRRQNPKAFTVSQLYNVERPPPVPLTEYEDRRKRRDLEDILQVGCFWRLGLTRVVWVF